jgi:tRNA threonylcarbamoyladenosine biosynthesis protein TsaE
MFAAHAHQPILETRSFDWPDEDACAAFAARLARAAALWPSTFIALDGPLGAGKTTFARHLLHALGVSGRIKSPTFAVMEPYEVESPAGSRSIAHFDFYRFADPREWIDAGFRDVFAAPGLKLAEWPDRAAAVLPAPDLRLEIEPIDEQARRVVLRALTPHGAELLEQATVA